ncbi:MAG: hypothetical protein HC848_07310 [Limnobacter sp.]|nr:hypothetical protein [Limnobacter sp.]
MLKTYRGQSLPEITYTMLVERGEGALISSNPAVITLCESSNGFYWPGVGAIFPGEEEVISVAEKTSAKIDSEQSSFSGCKP